MDVDCPNPGGVRYPGFGQFYFSRLLAVESSLEEKQW
jgi:hypothetical protein